MIAVLELHTYSSLNEQFMNEYNGSLEKADVAAVFYSKHALELKRMPELKKESVKKGFNKKDINVFNDKEELNNWLSDLDLTNAVVLFMSSGNYDGIDIDAYAHTITRKAV